MKRTARLYALFLTLCLMLGILAVGASAATSPSELDADFYMNQLKPSGATNYFARPEPKATTDFSASGQLGDTASKEIANVNGNKYYLIRRVDADPPNYSKEQGGYREIRVGGNSSKITDYGLEHNVGVIAPKNVHTEE